jgi:hypothetical protein
MKLARESLILMEAVAALQPVVFHGIKEGVVDWLH